MRPRWTLVRLCPHSFAPALRRVGPILLRPLSVYELGICNRMVRFAHQTTFELLSIPPAYPFKRQDGWQTVVSGFVPDATPPPSAPGFQ